MSHTRPNVLWLMTDEQRRDSLGCYGSPWARTPALDGIARQGVLFRQAMTPAPVCVPARVAILTGRHPRSTGVRCNAHRPAPGARWLTEVFDRHGYQTAGIGKQHYNADRPAFAHQVDRMTGDAVWYFDYLKDRDHAEYDAVRYPNPPYHWLFAGRFPEPAENTPEALNVTDALTWLDTINPEQPYLLRVSFNAPHTPVVAPAPYDTQIDLGAIQLPGPQALQDDMPVWVREGLGPIQGSAPLTTAELDRSRQCYQGLVNFIDAQVARLLEAMTRRGLLENTIIVFVSDHGTNIGDFGLMQKQNFFESAVGVPYFVAWPGKITPRQFEQPVAIHGLLPTLLALCGLPIPQDIEAPSLAECLLNGSEPQPQPVFAELDLADWKHRAGQRLLLCRHGLWKLSGYRAPDAAPGTALDDAALYHLGQDPHETRNVIHEREHRDAVAELLRLMEDYDQGLQG